MCTRRKTTNDRGILYSAQSVDLVNSHSRVYYEMSKIRIIYFHGEKYYCFLQSRSGLSFIALLSEKISENVGYAREAATEAVLEDT